MSEFGWAPSLFFISGIPKLVCRDPDDDHVLACALTAAAKLIVSGDADLLELANYEGTSIVAPAEALSQIEEQE